MWAVIVKMPWAHFSLVPFVVEVKKDCPKTLLTKGKWSDSRYQKKLIRYRLFETEEEAVASIPSVVSGTLEGEQELRDELRAAENDRAAAVKRMVAGQEWLGGK